VTATLYDLHALQQRRGSKLVLDVRALAIRSGRIHTLVGPNGSGKTTLLTTLAFLARPASGEMRFAGERVDWTEAALLPLRRQVTLVHQSPYLFAGTVEDNLAIGLSHRKLDRETIRSRIADALQAVALSAYARRDARALSQGEGQRVAVARALLLEPRVLLLDEPLANLDRKSAGILEELIGALPAEGRTVIMSTHDPEHPRRFGSVVIALQDGAVLSPTEDPVGHASEASSGHLAPRRGQAANPLAAVTFAAGRAGSRTIG
jgi:tungstate transport system ATP-binding protein